MNKYIFPIIKWKIKPWLKYYILNKKSAPSYPLSEIIEGTSPLTLENSIRKKFHIFNVGGNTEQQSYTGKNLNRFPYANSSGNYGGVTITVNNDGTLLINGTTTSTGYFNFCIANNMIALKAGTYTFSLGVSGFTGSIYDEDGKLLTSININEKTYTFTLSEDKNIRYFLSFYSGRTYNNVLVKPQLEEGSTATDYEPYVGGQASPNPSYPQPVENVSGEVEVKVANGTDSTAQGYEEQTATLHLPEGMEMCKIGTYVDIFTKSGSNWIVPNKILKIASYNGETITTPYISSTGGLDIGATVYYVGSEDYVITDPTLISDLESLKNLYSYKGTTHIFSTNEPSPVFEVQYYMEEGA